MIEENVARLLSSLSKGNGLGEKITLVAAVKTRTPEEINRAIRAGITDIGDNKVQEFTQKYDLIEGANRHFIGHLQRNKVKYLIGKVSLIHSVDCNELFEEIARQSEKHNVVTDVLLQVNISREQSKSGYPLSEALSAYETWKTQPNLRIRGFMGMLPAEGERSELCALADEMRALFDCAKKTDSNIAFLSMGMSGDYELCLERGANMIRLGTAIFGERNYNPM